MSCKKLLPLVTRQFTTTARRQADVVHPGYKELKLKQEMFQKEDGLLIHVKRGAVDRILYRLTLGLCIFGVGGCFASYYKMVVGKK